MPLGLTRKTRPFDCSDPRMLEGLLAVVTRFSTALAGDCWMKRVISPAPIENPCQLMIAFGELVILSVLPLGTTAAVPVTTVGPVGLETACVEAKQEATATASIVPRGSAEREFGIMDAPPRKFRITFHPVPERVDTCRGRSSLDE